MKKEILSKLAFPTFRDVSQRYSISDLCPNKLCGIYILRFGDRSYYVGQSINIARRFLQHKKNFNDLEAITFKRVKPAELNSEEQAIIGFMETRFTLRNISLTSLPNISDCELDEMISPEQQYRWLCDPGSEIKFYNRVNDPVLRFRTAKRCEELLKDITFKEQIVPVMQKYVRLCIPEPFQTEITFWGCSCLPKYDNKKIRY